MAKPILSFLAALQLAAGMAFGSEAWAFRFNARGLGTLVSWHDDLVFHNTTAQDAVVRLLGVSNGVVPEGTPAEVPLPAGRTVSMKNFFSAWEPQEGAELWVVHVEVPEGVLVFSRGGADSECPSPCAAPPNSFPNLGAFSMPVFRALVPAGQRQIHMGADLGTLPSRINVGIYNAGALAATATVVVYEACDDTILESRTLSVAADTTVQFGGMGSVRTHCAPETPLNTWLRYATVTMDQAGLSYIVNLADTLPSFPLILLSVP